MGSLQKVPAGEESKVNIGAEVIRRAILEDMQRSFCHSALEKKFPTYKWKSGIEKWYCERRFRGTTLYSGSKVFQRHDMTSAKSFGRYFKKACVAAGAYTHVIMNNEPDPLDQITERKKTSTLGLKLWSSCTLELNLYGHPVAGFWRERRHLRNIC